MLRFVSFPILAAICASLFLFVAAPARALLHTINFSDSSVTGTFDVDVSGLAPGTQINCNNGPPCAFSSFEVVFSGGEFTLDDLPSEVLIGYMGDAGFIDSLFVLMDDNSGTASGSILEMNYAPNTFNINPSGTYTISVVPEPGTALLTGLGLSFMSLRARRD